MIVSELRRTDDADRLLTNLNRCRLAQYNAEVRVWSSIAIERKPFDWCTIPGGGKWVFAFVDLIVAEQSMLSPSMSNLSIRDLWRMGICRHRNKHHRVDHAWWWKVVSRVCLRHVCFKMFERPNDHEYDKIWQRLTVRSSSRIYLSKTLKTVGVNICPRLFEHSKVDIRRKKAARSKFERKSESLSLRALSLGGNLMVQSSRVYIIPHLPERLQFGVGSP